MGRLKRDPRHTPRSLSPRTFFKKIFSPTVTRRKPPPNSQRVPRFPPVPILPSEASCCPWGGKGRGGSRAAYYPPSPPHVVLQRRRGSAEPLGRFWGSGERGGVGEEEEEAAAAAAAAALLLLPLVGSGLGLGEPRRVCNQKSPPLGEARQGPSSRNADGTRYNHDGW